MVSCGSGSEVSSDGGARRHRRIAQRVDFVGVSHRCHFSSWLRDWPMSHQAIVIRKGQTAPAHDGRMTSAMLNVRRITLIRLQCPAGGTRTSARLIAERASIPASR